jgi:hypothetical protein
MPRYRVMLRGEGFRTEIDGEERPVGFFTTRYVDVASSAEARERAVSSLRRERKFRGLSRSLSSENVAVEEMAEVSFWTHRFSWRHGFAFFMWEEKEGRDAEPCAAPNGGPATQLGNSGVTEGPPSVS